MPRLPAFAFTLLAVMTLSARAADYQILVKLPEGVQAKSAVATARELKLDVTGKIDGRKITFDKVLPETPYDVKITMDDGKIWWGVDMGWYSLEPAKPNAEPLGDDDREEIRKICQDVNSFYNHTDILIVNGTHQRATLLVQPMRDSAFHSDKGGEVIWRVELWYFQNQHGGWEAIKQVSKVLRRERFKTAKEYHAEADKIRWMPALGGIRASKTELIKNVVVEMPQEKDATPAKKD
jgi:hypothetical protein